MTSEYVLPLIAYSNSYFSFPLDEAVEGDSFSTTVSFLEGSFAAVSSLSFSCSSSHASSSGSLSSLISSSCSDASSNSSSPFPLSTSSTSPSTPVSTPPSTPFSTLSPTSSISSSPIAPSASTSFIIANTSLASSSTTLKRNGNTYSGRAPSPKRGSCCSTGVPVPDAPTPSSSLYITSISHPARLRRNTFSNG